MGFTVCDKVDIYDKVDLYLLAVLLKGDQITSDIPSRLRTTRSRILEAVYFAQDQINADVIGLGALCASATEGGRWLVRQDNITSYITHGDAYSVAISLEGIQKIVSCSGLKKPVIAVVGAYGLIGRALSRRLGEKYDLIMMGRNEAKLRRLKIKLNIKGTITTNMEDLKKADIVITATSHPRALLHQNILKDRAIIYDVSQPENVSKDLILRRPDLLKIDGPLTKTPGIRINFDMGTGQAKTFACLTETVMMTLEGIEAHSVGDIDIPQMEYLQSIGKKYGFTHAPFSQFGIPIKEEDLLRV
jgi:predicted amino acid dehydrogenase